MRIGILSLSLYVNYGGILQTYALQTALERMGHDVTFIQKRNWPLELKVKDIPIVYAKRIVKNLMGQHMPMLYEKIYNREAPIIRQNIEPFVRKHIRMKVVDDYRQICENDFDAIIVGSDQIWRPLYVKHIESAFLDFAKDWNNIKRVAYAASFGTDSWEYSKSQSEHCRKLVKLFNAVSVREASAVKLCREHFGVEAKHVLDPTMLLEAADYMKLFKESNTPKSDGNLLCYILDENEEKAKIISSIAKEKHLKPFSVSARPTYRYDLPVEERIQPSVERWLRGFYDADFIVTDSFHACVFSILFRKPFLVYGNKARGMSRFVSLLEVFELQDRIVGSMSEFKKKPLNEIDWNSVNPILSVRRKEANEFLKTALC